MGLILPSAGWSLMGHTIEHCAFTHLGLSYRSKVESSVKFNQWKPGSRILFWSQEQNLERVLLFLGWWGCEIWSCCSHIVATRGEPVTAQNPHMWELNRVKCLGNWEASFKPLWWVTSKAGPTSRHLSRYEPEVDYFFGQLQSQKISENLSGVHWCPWNPKYQRLNVLYSNLYIFI